MDGSNRTDHLQAQGPGTLAFQVPNVVSAQSQATSAAVLEYPGVVNTYQSQAFSAAQAEASKTTKPSNSQEFEFVCPRPHLAANFQPLVEVRSQGFLPNQVPQPPYFVPPQTLQPSASVPSQTSHSYAGVPPQSCKCQVSQACVPIQAPQPAGPQQALQPLTGVPKQPLQHLTIPLQALKPHAVYPPQEL